MKKHLIPIIAVATLISCLKEIETDEMVLAENIENIKIQDGEIGDDFVLFSEEISKPNEQAAFLLYQHWERNSTESDLKMIEEETADLVEPAGASCTQTWYRSEKKEKIEVDIIICPTESEINSTIENYTEKMYSWQFIPTDTPLAGDTSWVANSTYIESNRSTLMFLKANVFTRIYVNLEDGNIAELNVIISNVADNIEAKIFSELE